ncbi:MAG: leucyl/phenylalanyl-tRNA--protein transferase, partial [Deferribacterota bacterium]|nr:leucyl/phenylalanyl-tRNA--protein transferase [Deferribacterota bacterium]
VIFIKDFHIPRTIKKTIKKHNYTFSFNKDFMAVISGCATVKRKDSDTTWITDEMIEGYYKLFLMGRAFSIEVWEDSEIVGGLYGVKIEKYISAESMFHKRDNASDAALIKLVQLCINSNIPMIDCQITSDHIFRYNAIEITRKKFLDYLQILLNNKYPSISKGLS